LIERTLREPDSISIADVFNLYVSGSKNAQRVRQVLEIEALSESWKKHFRRVIEKLDVSPEVQPRKT
jgi:MOSC domain-containing protein YiiM